MRRKHIILLFAFAVTLDLSAWTISWLGAIKSGTPQDSIIVEKNGRVYWTGRGGPVEERELKEITPRQRDTRERYETAATIIAVIGGLLVMVCGGIVIAQGISKERSKTTR